MLHFDGFLVYYRKSLLILEFTLNRMTMKRILIFLLLLTFCGISHAQNQLLKRMQKKIENRIENKVESKILEKTDNSVDKVLDAPFNTRISKAKVSVEDLPSSYHFSWKYDVQIQTPKGKAMTMTYFLQPKATYQGMVLGDLKNDMFMIVDFEKQLMLSFMEVGGSKMAQTTNLALDDEDSANDSVDDFQTSSLPDQIIAGYKCKGMQLKNNDYLIKYYFTNDVPISLNGMNQNKKDEKLAKVINGINSKDPGLMMKMDMTDLKDKKNNVIMECKSLSKVDKTIFKKDYTFM